MGCLPTWCIFWLSRTKVSLFLDYCSMLLTSALVLENLDELGTLQEKVLKGTSPGCASTIFLELNLVR